MDDVHELPKKRGVPPPLRSTHCHCPFTEEATEGLRGVHLLVVAMTTKRLLVSATQEKAEVPPSALFDALTPLQRVDLMIPNSACVAIRRSAHREGGQAAPPKRSRLFPALAHGNLCKCLCTGRVAVRWSSGEANCLGSQARHPKDRSLLSRWLITCCLDAGATRDQCHHQN